MTKAAKLKRDQRQAERKAKAQAISPMAASVILGCSPDHVYDLIEEGQMRALNLAGHNNKSDRRNFRIPLTALHDFIRHRETLPAPGARSIAPQAAIR